MTWGCARIISRVWRLILEPALGASLTSFLGSLSYLARLAKLLADSMMLLDSVFSS
jgi:hypothetical protein